MPHDSSGVKADLVHRAVRGEAETRRDLDAERVREEKIAAIAVDMLAHRQHTRKCTRARMHRTDGMRVVVIETVREHAVHQRGVLERQSLRHADHSAARAVGERAETGERSVSEIEARRRE